MKSQRNGSSRIEERGDPAHPVGFKKSSPLFYHSYQMDSQSVLLEHFLLGFRYSYSSSAQTLKNSRSKKSVLMAKNNPHKVAATIHRNASLEITTSELLIHSNYIAYEKVGIKNKLYKLIHHSERIPS